MSPDRHYCRDCRFCTQVAVVPGQAQVHECINSETKSFDPPVRLLTFDAQACRFFDNKAHAAAAFTATERTPRIEDKIIYWAIVASTVVFCVKLVLSKLLS